MFNWFKRNRASLSLTLLPVAWLSTVLLPMPSVLREAISIPFVLSVPGYYLYRLIAGYSHRHMSWSTAAYSVGLSVLNLMVTGFAVNEIGQFMGDPAPLKTLPLAVTVALTSVITGRLAALRHPNFALRLPNISHPWILAAGALLPLLAIGGANTLNNGGSGWLAVFTLFAICAFFVAVAWKGKSQTWLYPYALYTAGLAILLGSSMRGWNITGHDVMQEFQVYQLTAQHSVWHMHFYKDAYNACLSITILPTLLQRLTGVSDPYVFKFIAQLVFALVPPIVYLSVRRLAPAVMGFLAGLVFLTFPTFITDMSFLTRQESAFLFLSLAIMTQLDATLSRKVKGILAFTFMAGVVLSHYSTAYVTVGILFFALILAALAKLWVLLRKKPTSSFKPLFFPGTVAAATLLMVVGWNTLATQTSDNIAQTLGGVYNSLPRILSTLSTPPVTSTANGAVLVDQYAAAQTAGRTLPSPAYYPASTVNQDQASYVKEPTTPVTKLGNLFHLPQTVFYKLFDSLKGDYAKLIQGLVVLSAALVVLSHRARRRMPEGYVVLAIACLVMIGLQVVLPSNLINYGLTRLIQQGLIVLSLPVVTASFWLLGRFRIPDRLHHKILAVGLGGFFLILSGAIPALTGGYKAELPVSNSGFYYEAYYTHQEEIQADTWLARNTPQGSHVYSDDFIRRQMMAYSGIYPSPTLVPSAIPVDSYVFLSNSNTTFSNVPTYFQGSLIYYSVPHKFLNSNKNLVYSSGGVQVYH